MKIFSGFSGVDVYVVDSGINIGHEQFEGRAEHGVDYTGQGPDDEHWHGTHCAGTIGGRDVGVAKNAHLISVKVSGATGGSNVSRAINGFNWIVQQHQASGNPSVVNISLTFGKSDSLDLAVTNAVNAGITVVVSAGNQNVDSCTRSPPGAAGALTVGASAIDDSRAGYSNYGT